MSGTSLDGVDICFATFQKKDEWSYTINSAHTYDLPVHIKEKLQKATKTSGLELSLLSNEFGDYIGDYINQFINKFEINGRDVDFIASHGQTIFHQPENKLTLQIGNGANISSLTKIPTICDFRSSDLALEGNGAPLVPIGDEHLFHEYDCCVNIGGIANLSYQNGKKRIAFDICVANMALNYLANRLGKEFDKNGELAKSGKVIPSLLNELNQLDYYTKLPPKSLGYEWFEEYFNSFLNGENRDLLHTVTEHIAIQISKHIYGKTLFTGGGTFNEYLIERINHHSKANIIVPNDQLINFKEALIFGFLGVLRWRNEINTLKSVTGAKVDNIGGCIYTVPNFN